MIPKINKNTGSGGNKKVKSEEGKQKNGQEDWTVMSIKMKF